MIRALPVLPATGVLINGEGCRRPLIARLIRLREPDRAETSLAAEWDVQRDVFEKDGALVP